LYRFFQPANYRILFQFIAFAKEANLREETLKNESGFVNKRTPSEVFISDIKPLLARIPQSHTAAISEALSNLREKLNSQGHKDASAAVKEFETLASYPTVYTNLFEVSSMLNLSLILVTYS
jgi:hypothetical protein